MTRSSTINRSVLAALGTAGLGITLALAGSSSSQAAESLGEITTRSGSVPPVLAVPDGHVASADLAARGVQVYTCTAGAWAFTEPAATLAGRTTTRPRSAQTAIHFRGPSWQSTLDGSLVTAAVVANSPVPGSIPELLLKASSNRGTGIFGKVSYIQRLDTTGGAAPAGACTDGATTGVQYTAKYRFFTPAS